MVMINEKERGKMPLRKLIGSLAIGTTSAVVLMVLRAYFKKCEEKKASLDRDNVEELNISTLAKWYLNNKGFINEHPEVLHAVINPEIIDENIKKQIKRFSKGEELGEGYSTLIQCLFDQEKKQISKVNLIKYKVVEDELHEILEKGRFYTVGMTIMNQKYE